MNTTIISPIKQLGKVSPTELSKLKEWLKYIEPFMIKSVSTYAQGRRELHIRHFVKLAGKDSKKLGDEVVKIPDSVAKSYQSELIESIGERLLPGFHEGLVLHYPKGTLIKPHRDSRAYMLGAASINIIGNATFFISDNQDASNMFPTQLGEGDQIWFDNKQPHAIAKVEQDRWCVCFFYLKQEFLPKTENQLSLIPEPAKPTVQTTITSYPDRQTEKPPQAVQVTPTFTNPRYTWTDAPRWWNPYGEEIAWAEHPHTKERRYIKAVEHIPTDWGVVLDYGGRIIPAKDLKRVLVGGV